MSDHDPGAGDLPSAGGPVGEPPTVPLPAVPPDGWATTPDPAAQPLQDSATPTGPQAQAPGAPPTEPYWGATPGYSPPVAYGAPGHQQPYMVAPVNPFQSRATTVLVLGIVGIVACQLVAPVAWIQGNSLKGDAEAAGWPEPDMAKIGRILGIVGSALLAIFGMFFVVYLILAFVALGATATGG